VPQATSATSRSCGYAPASFPRSCFPAAGRFPPAPGLPDAAVLAWLASASTVVPSRATASSPHTCDHGGRPGAGAGHSRRNSDSSGFSPARRRTPVSAVVAGTCQPAAASAASRPGVISRSTCPYGRWLDRHYPMPGP